MSNIRSINAAIKAYFKANPDKDIVAAKGIMPQLLAKGVYIKDEKNGLPIRNELKALDNEGKLDKIRTVHVVRKGAHNFWYFLREGAKAPELEVDNIPSKKDTRRQLNKQANSDEHYVIDLCDRVLSMTGVRQHTFDFLRGDLHRNGRTKSKLPCGAYYSKHKLVVDFSAKALKQEFESEEHRTASGKTRSEQRELYKQRKKEVLPSHKIAWIEIEASAFALNDKNLILRDEKEDLKTVKKAARQIRQKRITSAHRLITYLASTI